MPQRYTVRESREGELPALSWIPVSAAIQTTASGSWHSGILSTESRRVMMTPPMVHMWRGFLEEVGKAAVGNIVESHPAAGSFPEKCSIALGREVENLIRAIEWVIEQRDVYRIRILNISAGTTRTEEDRQARELLRCVERAWDGGLVVIVAAGNLGPDPESITIPGNCRKVITVGAFDHYSGCGPDL